MELSAVLYHYKIYLALIQMQFTKYLEKYTKPAEQQKVAENVQEKKQTLLTDSA